MFNLNNLRCLGFWVMDATRNRAIAKALNGLLVIDSLDSRDNRLVEYRERELERLLTHAIETTEFYKGMTEARIERFPVVDKSTIKEQYDSFLSSKYRMDKLVIMQTSGSTGTPFTCYQDLEKKRRVYAEVIYYCGQAGYKLGRRIVYLRALTSKSRKSRIRQWLENQSLIDCSDLGDARLHHILSETAKLSKGDGVLLLSYPSTYRALLDYIERCGRDFEFNIYGIISSSEFLDDNLRNRLTDVFGCKCFSRYANQENGLLGQDTPEHPNQFIINEAHYYIEVLRFDSDKVAEDGEIGRIVVTDLFNYGMPMIRYDTGDIGAMGYVKRDGVWRRAITDFGGRRLDTIYDANGNRISPYAIVNHLWSYPDIRQYQFIQDDAKKYTMRIAVDDSFDKDDQLRNIIAGFVGKDAEIRIERVRQIPKLPSGKHRYIVNNWSRDGSDSGHRAGA